MAADRAGMQLFAAGWIALGVLLVSCAASWTLGRFQRGRAAAHRGPTSSPQVVTVDPVSGLPTHSRLVDQVDDRLKVCSHNRGIGVLVCAPDRLSMINEALGHRAGDEILATAGRRIKTITRGNDVVVRFVGHQFVVVPAQVPTERDLQLLADRLLGAINGPVALAGGSTHHLSASVGIAAAFDEHASADDLIRDASLARRRAALAGGGRSVMCADSDRAGAGSRLQMERDIRLGLEQQQFVVHYQPIVDLQSGVVDWFEALVRWHHPVRGILHPGAFLRSAGELGLALALNDEVLGQACAQAVAWAQSAARPVSVSINIDRRLLIDPELAVGVDRALTTSGLAPSLLKIEIDQEILGGTEEGLSGAIHRLVALGVEVVVDNATVIAPVLGRGIEELTYKLDRSLLDCVATPYGPPPILDSCIPGARPHAPTVIVAQGVERPEQLDLLRQSSVRHGQGFWLQRPAAPDQLAPLLRDGCSRIQPLVSGGAP